MAIDSTRLIPSNLRGNNTLIGNLPVVGDFVGDASAMDVVYAVVIPAFITMWVTQQLPESIAQYGAYILLLVIAIGFGLIGAIPSYTSLSGLMNQFKNYHTKSSERRLYAGDGEDPEVKQRPWQTAGDTRELAEVRKIYGNQGVVEREDDVVVGAVRVRGMNLDTATDETEKMATQSFANFLNSGLDYPIQIFSTTRRFNPEHYLEKFEDRLDNEEIKDNRVMTMYINHYIQRTPQFLSQQYYREHYVMVPVSMWDVREQSRQEGALNLSVIPLIGDILAEIFGKSDISEITEEQRKQRQINECMKRLQNFKQNGIGSLSGAKGEVITDPNQYAALIKEFWESRDMSFKQDKEFIRSSPVVMGEPDRDKVEDRMDSMGAEQFSEQLAEAEDEGDEE